jgi:NAD(P)-dependent dehydrogenase (short-subunit alcohol dehydrogenase family)
MRMQGKVAIVTGAGSGIGRATAARILGRRPWWVENRLALALKLASYDLLRADGDDPIRDDRY